MMEIIKFAMQMELDGRAFYMRSAENASTKELKEIFTYLADEEMRHFNFFKSIDEGDTKAAMDELANGKRSFEGTKNLFAQLTEEGKEKKFSDEARAVWTEALEIEEKAVELYTQEAGKETNAERKKLLEKIADEERNHIYLIDNVLSYLTDPASFTESKKYADFKSWEGR